MTSPEQTKRTNSSQTSHGTEVDPASNRPMSPSDIREAYADYADRMQRFEWVDRALLGRYRRARFGDVEGDVLDVACGTGTNFPYLPETVDLVGIDVSPAMLANARERLAENELDGTLQEMDAQELEFGDNRFDAVISALSTCTFPDPIAALREMERVCKPGGTIRLVEHGRSDVGPIAAFQDWRADDHYETMGCRWTQEPCDIVTEAGLSVQDMNTGLLGMITTFEIKVE